MKPSQTCIGSAVPWASWNRLGKPPAPSTQRSPFPAPRPLQGPGGPPFSAQRTVSGLFAALEGRVRALPEVKGPVTVGPRQRTPRGAVPGRVHSTLAGSRLLGATAPPRGRRNV